MSYTTVPNQKVMVVKKERCDKNNYYAAINLEALQEAMSNLNNTEFKLWMYFAKNQNEHSFAYSPSDCISNWGFTRTSLYNAFAALEAKGYIQQKEGNVFIFSEIPNRKIRKSQNLISYSSENEHECSKNEQGCSENEHSCSKSDREILHNNTLNNTLNNTYTCRKRQDYGWED